MIPSNTPISTLSQQFDAPDASWRGKPFWAWNGRLEKAELLRQVHIMKQMGFGGFFIHSRTGLVTEYLGDEWFELVNACADEAEKLGMEAWLYDEDRWPSGLAGGLVTQHPEYRALSLRMERMPLTDLAKARASDRLVAIFLAEIDGLDVRRFERLQHGQAPARGDNRTLLVFRVVENPSSSFYNGFTYLDTLNRAATDAFLQVTHEAYRKRCGDRLGQSITGIFTDEPHRGRLMVSDGGHAAGGSEAPWTASLPKRFRDDFGYDLIDHLPEIYLRRDGQAVSQVKWHFVECLQRMFLDNFAKPYAEWCRRNKLQVTGHILHEDTLAAQAAMSGSMMRYYEHMDIPGIDVLTRGNRAYWIVKQLSSSARQLGKTRLLSELYACTGWDMPFSDHKAIGDWQALFGINLRCPHLSWYTMEGEAKRDYPASFNHHSTWWQHYETVERYFARIGIILAQGQPACDVLVINPVESVWCQVHEGWAHWLDSSAEWHQQLMGSYTQIFAWLCGAQIDFDYGDEDMLARLGTVHSGGLQVGKARYRTVVVPRLTTMRSSTLALLKHFKASGGTVIFADAPPQYINAQPSQDAVELAADCQLLQSCDRTTLVAAVDAALGGAQIRITTADGTPAEGVFAQLRHANGFDVLMLLNTDRSQGARDLRVRVMASGSLEEWDCQTGTRTKVSARRRGMHLEFSERFEAGGSHTYVIRHQSATRLPTRRTPETVRRSISRRPYSYRLSEPNVCVLDFAQARIGNGTWGPKQEILRLDQAVRRELGLEQRGGSMLQPWWVARQNGGKPNHTTTVAFRYDFEIAEIPETPIELAIERPSLWGIRINGIELHAANACGWWVDASIQRMPIPPTALRLGTNTVEIESGFHYGSNPEALYILGAFGVTIIKNRQVIHRMPDLLHPRDVTQQGLPFYSGSIVYQIPMKKRAGTARDRWFLSIGKFGGTCATVGVSGLPRTTIPWQPFEADVTDLLRSGASHLDLEIVTSRRNSFGPLHQFPARADGVNPDSFRSTGEHFRDDYALVPAGLLTVPVFEFRT